MSSHHTDYFRMRALEERERAASSDTPSIAAIHQSLAEGYEKLVQLMEMDGSIQPDFDGSAAA